MASQMMYRSMGLCTCMLVDGTAATVGLARPAGPGATWHYRTVPFKKYSLKLFYCIFVLFVLYCILTPLGPAPGKLVVVHCVPYLATGHPKQQLGSCHCAPVGQSRQPKLCQKLQLQAKNTIIAHYISLGLILHRSI